MQTAQLETARSQYESDGFYIHAEPLLPADVVERAIAGMDAVRDGEYDTGTPPEESPWNPGDDPDKLCKIENPQFASHGVMELISHPALGQLVGELTEAQWVQVWWVQLLYKPPTPATGDANTNIGWHTDRAYWCPPWQDRSELFTAWVAVSDVTEQSGPMKFVPGSNKVDLGKQGDFDAQDLAAQRDGIQLPDGMPWRELPAIMQPGGLSIHNFRTLHGSGPNESDQPRCSFAIHMRTDKSWPMPGHERIGLTEFIDDTERSPIVYRA